MVHQIDEINQALNTAASQFAKWIQDHGNANFEEGINNKWAVSQHLDHLVKSTTPLIQGLKMPRFTIRMMFGKPNRPPRDFDGVVQRYTEKLAANAGVPTPAGYVPTIGKIAQKDEMIDLFLQEIARLSDQLGKWKEEDLDHYLLPHPLLGKMTIREMMFFTLHHINEHLRFMQRDFS